MTAGLLSRFEPAQMTPEDRGFDALLWLATLARAHQLGEDDLPLVDLEERHRLIARAAAEQERIRSAASMVATTVSRLSSYDGGFDKAWSVLVEAVDERESYTSDDLASVLGESAPRTLAAQEYAIELLDGHVRDALVRCYWGGPRKPAVTDESSAKSVAVSR